MNKIVKLALALGALAIFTVPSSIQAYEPPDRDFIGHHHHHHHQGLRITSVAVRSPASRAGLERGDVILEVDGQDIQTGDQLHRALHRTGYRGMLTVRDARSGRIHRVQVFPADGHIGVTVAKVGW